MVVQTSKSRSGSFRQKTNKSLKPTQTPATPGGSLTTEFIQILHHNASLASPALNLLELFLCLWECYVVKYAEKIRLQEEQRQLRQSNEWLASENNFLLQRCNEQALMLWARERAAYALHNGVISVLYASDRRAYWIDRP